MRMSYNTYVTLRDFINKAQLECESGFHRACDFIPEEPYVNGKPSSRDKAHSIFTTEYYRLENMKKELLASAASTYKDHPSEKMREFWGV